MEDKATECLSIAAQELRLARQYLIDEIQNYPSPIAGCDVQFNHLLAQRRRVQEALEALDMAYFVPTPRQPFPETKVESR